MNPHTQRGTVRRIRALIARGWSVSALAAELQIPVATVSGISWNRHLIRPELRERIADLYDRARNILPPDRSPAWARITMARAHANGWVPPHHWNDIDHDPHPHPHSHPEAAAS